MKYARPETPHKNPGLFINTPFSLRLLAWVAAGSAALAIGTLFVLVILRAGYPYELEWAEGAVLDQVQWILAGHFPYSPPTLQFLPLAYNPFYFYVAAAFSVLVGGVDDGAGFLGLRLVSILAILATLVLLYRLVKDSTGSALAGWLAAGFYAASYRFTGAWMDLAKTDSLFLALLLLAYWAALRRAPAPPGRSVWIISGLLFALAYFTKQLALPVLVVLAPVSLLLRRGRNWLLWLTAFGAAAAVFLTLEISSGGWFSFYTLRAAQYHPRQPALQIFWGPLLTHWTPALLLILIDAGAALRGWRLPASLVQSGQPDAAVRDWTPADWEDQAFGLGLLLASWSIFFKSWTYDNGFMPAALSLSLLAGLTIGRVLSSPSFTAQARQNTFWRLAAPWLALAAAVLQFVLLAYSPLAQLPTAADRQDAGAVVAQLRALPGELWVTQHPYLGRLAGKGRYMHSVALGDLLGGEAPPPASDDARRREQVASVFHEALDGQVFEWIIVDQPAAYWQPYYIPVGLLDKSFTPVTGAPAIPTYILGRNPVVNGEALPLDDPHYDSLFLENWQPASPIGRSLTGWPAELQVWLAAGAAYELRLSAEPGCPAGSPVSAFSLFWNDVLVGQARFNASHSQEFRFPLPLNETPGPHRLQFLLPEPVNAVASTENACLTLTSLEFHLLTPEP